MSNGTTTSGMNLIGDIYPNLVTTPHTMSYYVQNGWDFGNINKEVLDSLDNFINYGLYDNCSINIAGTPDGIVDMIFMIYRYIDTTDADVDGMKGGHGNFNGIATLGTGQSNYVTNDLNSDNEQVSISFKIAPTPGGDRVGSGITIDTKHDAMNLYYIAHEFGHFLFGGFHFGPQGGCNLMQDSPCYWPGGMNSYERSKLGYINPTTISSDQTLNLGDYYSTGSAVKLPIAGLSDEYFLVENRSVTNIYDRSPVHGVYFYHIIGEGSYNTELQSPDGFWDYALDGNNDVYKTTANAVSGANWLEIIKIGTVWGYRYPYTVNSIGRDVVNGNVEDAFNINYAQVFSPWTNPSSNAYTYFNGAGTYQRDINTNIATVLNKYNGTQANISFYIGSLSNVSGNISSNTTWSRFVNVSGTVTVNAGVTLTISAGTKVVFSSGSSLIVNGTLSAVGNSSNRITFDRNGTSGSWNGIQFNSGSSGSVSYCNINNAYTGIYCNNSSSPSISYNTFTNCGTYGIRLNNSSPTISFNTISGTGSYGINCQYSSPILSHNVITGQTSYGLNCYSSTAYMNNASQGNNVIRQNGAGIAAGYSSSVYLSSRSNCVHGNTGYEVFATNSSTVLAENTWWYYTTSPYYTASDFLIQSGSSVDYIPNNLTSDPNGCPLPKISSDIDFVADDNGISLDRELTELLSLENERKYDEVIPKYLKKYDKESNKEIKRYIISRLAWCYKGAGKSDFADLLNNKIRMNVSKDDELYASTLEAENILLISNSNYKEAADNFLIIKNNFPKNESLYKYALFNLGSIYTFQLGDKESGKEYFDELKTNYPNDELTVHSMLQLGEIDGYILPEPIIKKTISNITEESSEYSLSENFPNPFNPSTTISFTLPEDGKVQIKVFDILGREVATLMNGFDSKGKHSVTWDGSNASSGIYFCTITFKNQTISKKMLLVK